MLTERELEIIRKNSYKGSYSDGFETITNPDVLELTNVIQQLRKERELLIFEKEQVLTLLKATETTELHSEAEAVKGEEKK